jgi:hypothetical protein
MTRVLAHETMTLSVPTPRLGLAWDKSPDRYLTIGGVPAYQLAFPCGTCGLVLRRQPDAPPGQLRVDHVRDRLAAGLDRLDRDIIEAFAEQLPRGDYLVLLTDVVPHMATPDSAEDYFATEQPRTWQHPSSRYTTAPTNISYYRCGHARLSPEADLFQFAVPMHDPDQNDPATVARYSGHGWRQRPTAVALGLLDISGPWFSTRRHWGLFHFLLDGHHKTAAAATLRRPLRLLTLISVTESLASAEAIHQLPALLAKQP